MNRRRYEHAGFGLTLLGGALVFGAVGALIEGITGAPSGSVAPALLAIPFGIAVLVIGITLVMMLTFGLFVGVPMAAAERVSDYRQSQQPKAKRTPVAGDPCYRCSFRSPTGADLFNEYGSMLFCIDKVACAKRAAR